MELIFKNLKPISVNHAKKFDFKRKMLYTTKEAVEFEKRIFMQCLKYRPQINEIEDEFDDTHHCLKATYDFYMPKQKLFTKKNYISHRSLDVDNCIKYLQDGIFKNFNKIDDSAICFLNANKKISDDNNYNIVAKFELIFLKDVYEY